MSNFNISLCSRFFLKAGHVSTGLVVELRAFNKTLIVDLQLNQLVKSLIEIFELHAFNFDLVVG
jgi:hypothetical protein